MTLPNPWGIPDINKMDKFFVGFDNLFDRLHATKETLAKNIGISYPPYNIVKLDENKYVIEIAVAGFAKQHIDLELQDGKLTVTGKIESDSNEGAIYPAYMYKGIADRAFTRTFQLADTIEVKNADLINGMLKIWLENMIPDSRKPKKIDINDTTETPSAKQLLTEEKKTEE